MKFEYYVPISTFNGVEKIELQIHPINFDNLHDVLFLMNLDCILIFFLIKMNNKKSKTTPYLKFDFLKQKGMEETTCLRINF
jgi:hypothetical protein